MSGWCGLLNLRLQKAGCEGGVHFKLACCLVVCCVAMPALIACSCSTSLGCLVAATLPVQMTIMDGSQTAT